MHTYLKGFSGSTFSNKSLQKLPVRINRTTLERHKLPRGSGTKRPAVINIGVFCIGVGAQLTLGRQDIFAKNINRKN